jgi:hypothetical protein
MAATLVGKSPRPQFVRKYGGGAAGGGQPNLNGSSDGKSSSDTEDEADEVEEKRLRLPFSEYDTITYLKSLIAGYSTLSLEQKFHVQTSLFTLNKITNPDGGYFGGLSFSKDGAESGLVEWRPIYEGKFTELYEAKSFPELKTYVNTFRDSFTERHALKIAKCDLSSKTSSLLHRLGEFEIPRSKKSTVLKHVFELNDDPFTEEKLKHNIAQLALLAESDAAPTESKKSPKKSHQKSPKK